MSLYLPTENFKLRLDVVTSLINSFILLSDYTIRFRENYSDSLCPAVEVCAGWYDEVEKVQSETI